jgi:NDP-sugar pyrophosphorylase family protein
MRAMIVAAGLGTRLRPLTNYCPKPALPVRGLPLIAHTLDLLARSGVREVAINVHHLPDVLIAAAREHCPPGLTLEFSMERELLDTGGGIRRMAAFLRESDPCIVVGGDMRFELDLRALVERHVAARRAATLLLLGDPRAAEFGSIGIDARGRIRRIAKRFDLGGEVRAGLYTWINVFSPRLFDSLPEREVFSHLDHWIAPRLAAGADDIVAELATPAECRWQPVGTPEEYLAANLAPTALTSDAADSRARARGARFEGDLVIGAGAAIAAGARLSRCVIWDAERVPADCSASDGVFARGAFHACRPPASAALPAASAEPHA